jgi:class 3 adenylate cyclase/tetratricopeptide (TPR) repeat protein
MAGCPSCGRDNPDDARFCNACGAALAPSEPARETRKVVTVLFCDVVGSTALGEATDPEALRTRMRRYFEDLRVILERHGGSVEKFAGDAVMAVFGIPVAHEDDGLRAIRAATEMRDAIVAHGLEARIGVNTGEVVVGGGSETLVTGDAVNVAARLEQTAAAGEILIGERTRSIVRDAVRVEPVEPLVLKGKSEPVEAHRLVELVGDEPLARRLETPLVGRERERRRLWRDFEDVVADRTCRLFTLLGPAGIGKSRLVADFVERVGDSADVLRGRCLPYGDGITYWPLVEMLAPLGIDPESVVGSIPEETQVAFRRLLEARAGERPQIVVVDDLQWAEPVFVDLVEHVADLSRGAPILLLCIARTELLETRPHWGGGKLNAASLLLEPLPAEECAALMELLVPDAELDPELRARITEASAGYPLYVEEMLAMVREHGGTQVVVPPTIEALLQARIDSLDVDVRVVLERGAIEGEVFHHGALAELVPDELSGELDTHLASLVRKELIWPERSLAPGESAYRFRHILVREVAYGSMPKELRARLHDRFADWLVQTTDESALELDEIVGYHLERACRFRLELGDVGHDDLASRAAARLLRAGDAALGRADFHAAAALLERGAALLPTGDAARLAALCDLAHARIRRGELESAGQVLGSTIDEAEQAGDRGLEARARLMLNSHRTRTDPGWSVETELDQGLGIAASLEKAGDLPNLARAYTEIGLCRFMLGQAGDGERDLGRATELARRVGDRKLERDALVSRLRPIAWGPTPAAEGAAYCDSLIESELANAGDKAHALQVRGLFAALQGDFDEARAAHGRSRALLEEFGLHMLRSLHAIDVGFAEALVGDLERAENELRQGHDFSLEVGDTGARCTTDAMLANVLVDRGRLDEAAELALESNAIAAEDDLDAQPRWRAALARVLSRRGEHARAEKLAREAVALVEPTDLMPLKGTVFDALAEVLAHSGRAQEAADVRERAIASHEAKGNIVSAARSRAALAELRSGSPS